jgi:hypothetical protein
LEQHGVPGSDRHPALKDTKAPTNALSEITDQARRIDFLLKVASRLSKSSDRTDLFFSENRLSLMSNRSFFRL